MSKLYASRKAQTGATHTYTDFLKEQREAKAAARIARESDRAKAREAEYAILNGLLALLEKSDKMLTAAELARLYPDMDKLEIAQNLCWLSAEWKKRERMEGYSRYWTLTSPDTVSVKQKHVRKRYAEIDENGDIVPHGKIKYEDQVCNLYGCNPTK